LRDEKIVAILFSQKLTSILQNLSDHGQEIVYRPAPSAPLSTRRSPMRIILAQPGVLGLKLLLVLVKTEVRIAMPAPALCKPNLYLNFARVEGFHLQGT
jgi:hypothetical protein